jgi:hypothetical protein
LILIMKFRNINFFKHFMINDQYKLVIVDRLVNCKTIKCNYVHYFMISSNYLFFDLTISCILWLLSTKWLHISRGRCDDETFQCTTVWWSGGSKSNRVIRIIIVCVTHRCSIENVTLSSSHRPRDIIIIVQQDTLSLNIGAETFFSNHENY